MQAASTAVAADEQHAPSVAETPAGSNAPTSPSHSSGSLLTFRKARPATLNLSTRKTQPLKLYRGSSLGSGNSSLQLGLTQLLQQQQRQQQQQQQQPQLPHSGTTFSPLAAEQGGVFWEPRQMRPPVSQLGGAAKAESVNPQESPRQQSQHGPILVRPAGQQFIFSETAAAQAAPQLHLQQQPEQQQQQQYGQVQMLLQGFQQQRQGPQQQQLQQQLQQQQQQQHTINNRNINYTQPQWQQQQQQQQVLLQPINVIGPPQMSLSFQSDPAALCSVGKLVNTLLDLAAAQASQETARELREQLLEQVREAAIAAAEAEQPFDLAAAVEQLLPDLQRAVLSACKEAEIRRVAPAAPSAPATRPQSGPCTDPAAVAAAMAAAAAAAAAVNARSTGAAARAGSTSSEQPQMGWCLSEQAVASCCAPATAAAAQEEGWEVQAAEPSLGLGYSSDTGECHVAFPRDFLVPTGGGSGEQIVVRTPRPQSSTQSAAAEATSSGGGERGSGAAAPAAAAAAAPPSAQVVQQVQLLMKAVELLQQQQ